MTPLPFPRKQVPSAVLWIEAGSVEWCERAADGRERRARIDLDGADPAALVRGIGAVRRAAAAESRAFVLALAQPLCCHRLLTLPALARKDLAHVFQRRARALVGEDARRIHFIAHAMDHEVGEPGGGASQRTWLLAALGHGMRELLLRLRDQGLRAQRIVSTELAALEWGRQRAPDPEQAALVIVVGAAAVSVALTCAGRLHYYQSIEGDLASRPALATGLVHEIKTCAAFWKKKSRGQAVGQVVVVGLPKARVELLALTLASILPGASVHSAAVGADEASGRLDLLHVPLASGPLNPDLTFWLPARTRQVGLAVTLLATAAVALTLFLFERARGQAEEVRAQASALRRGSADLEELRLHNEEADALLEQVERYARRGASMAAYDLPAERVLAAVLAACAGRAEFSELDIHAGTDGSARVAIRGRCAGDPALLVTRLRALMLELERGSALSALTLALPEDLEGESARGTPFTLEALLGSGA